MRRRARTLLLVGPDGAGKSAIADELRSRVQLDGRQVIHIHARPGIVLGRESGAQVTDPHAKPPRSITISLTKLMVLWLDNILGAAKWRFRHRAALVIIERGWYDMAVDLRRYRLPPSLRRVVLALGRLLPRADAVVLVTASPEVVAERKSELSESEIHRQQQVWSGLVGRAGRRTIRVDTESSDPEQCVSRILGDQRATSWRGVPFAPPRLDMRASGRPRNLSRIYRPQARMARVAAPIARVASAAGVGPSVGSPDPGLTELMQSLGLGTPLGAVAMRSSRPGRWIFGVRTESLQTVIKVGPMNDEGLQNEMDFLQHLGNARLPFGVPAIIWAGAWHDRLVLATHLVSPRTRRRPLLDDIASICTVMVGGDQTSGSIVHGDVAPWNVLQARDQKFVIDWEQARRDRRPLWDLSHYVLQQGALVGHCSPGHAVELLTAPGSPGWRHLTDVGETPSAARELLLTYLNSPPPSDPRAVRYRDEIRRILGT